MLGLLWDGSACFVHHIGPAEWSNRKYLMRKGHWRIGLERKTACEDLLGLSGRFSGLVGLLKEIRFFSLSTRSRNLRISLVLLCFLLLATGLNWAAWRKVAVHFFCSWCLGSLKSLNCAMDRTSPSDDNLLYHQPVPQIYWAAAGILSLWSISAIKQLQIKPQGSFLGKEAEQPKSWSWTAVGSQSSNCFFSLASKAKQLILTHYTALQQWLKYLKCAPFSS